jgi:hypothetical protein
VSITISVDITCPDGLCDVLDNLKNFETSPSQDFKLPQLHSVTMVSPIEEKLICTMC